MLLLLCLLVIVTLLLLYFHVTRNFNYWKSRNVPYVKPIPLFGNMFKIITMQQSVGNVVHELYKTTDSPYIGFFGFDKPFLLVRDPELLKSVLITDFSYFCDRWATRSEQADDVASNFLFLLHNPTWKNVRDSMASAYSTNTLKKMVPLMVECSNSLLQHINETCLKHEPIEIRELCLKHTTDVVVSCAYGITAETIGYGNSAFRVTSKRIFDGNFSRLFEINCYFIAPILVKLFKMKLIEAKSATFLKKVLHSVIKEREKVSYKKGDIIDVLINLKRKNENKNSIWDDNMLVTQAIQFFFAAFETTGTTISYTLYELSLNRAIQSRLRDEIHAVYNKHGDITYEAIQEMKYLDMVLCETLRKYPSLPFLDRYCIKNYHVPNTNMVIEKGTPIFISVLGLHHDPKYFPNPEKFEPERFKPEKRILRPSLSYMPFGEGPRQCIGNRFAMLSAKTTIIRILLSFEVLPTDNPKMPIKFDERNVLMIPEEMLNVHFVPIN